jgi:hypothetical protein
MFRAPALILLCSSILAAAEGEPAPAEILPSTDPGLHIEARAEQTYRSRDLDALLLVTRRHLGRALEADEEHALRRLLAQILVAREDLLPLLERLPPALSPHARDELLLDLLAYRPEPVAEDPAPEPPAGTPEAAAVAGEAGPLVDDQEGPLPPSTEGLAPPSATAPTVAEPAPAAAPPVAEDLIPLPALQLSRRGRDGSDHRLAIVVALQLGEHDDRRVVLAQLPVLQDAFITTLHALDEAAITSPDPTLLKRELGNAARRAAPDFTGEVLITSLTDPALQR